MYCKRLAVPKDGPEDVWNMVAAFPQNSRFSDETLQELSFCAFRDHFAGQQRTDFDGTEERPSKRRRFVHHHEHQTSASRTDDNHPAFSADSRGLADNKSASGYSALLKVMG